VTAAGVFVGNAHGATSPAFEGAVDYFRDRLAPVAGRYVFYNNSSFDGRNPGHDAADDSAIAVDKAPYFGSGRAAFANYTSYHKGLNGLIVDIVDLPGSGTTLDASSFEFRRGNSDDPSSWTSVTAAPAISVRRGQGLRGSDRVVITWPDYDPLDPVHTAVSGVWLEVTVKATAETGLIAPDVFYYGNAVAETGNDPESAEVTPADEIDIRTSRTGFRPASLDSPHDVNRDRQVNAFDDLIARNNQTSDDQGTALRLIQLTGQAQAATAPQVATSAEHDAALADTGPTRPGIDWNCLDWLEQWVEFVAEQDEDNG
jgi:hypothetical protein